MSLGRFADAEAEFRRRPWRQLTPEQKLSWDWRVRIFSGKCACLVIVEDLIKSLTTPATTFVLYARLLAGAGDERRAASMYRRGIDLDPDVADAELAERLGVLPADATEFDDADVSTDGRQRAARKDRRGSRSGRRAVARSTLPTWGDGVGQRNSYRSSVGCALDLYEAYGKSAGGCCLYGLRAAGKPSGPRHRGKFARNFWRSELTTSSMWIGNGKAACTTC